MVLFKRFLSILLLLQLIMTLRNDGNHKLLARHSLLWKPERPIARSAAEPFIDQQENKSFNNKSTYVIPSLSVINQMAAGVPENIKAEFKKTILVGCQHNLETTVTLYKAIKSLGIKRIYSVGKCYSDSEVIKQAMVQEGICLMPSNRPAMVGGLDRKSVV